MKKTLTINLGGLVFNIDDDAFVVLKSYLDTIKGYFDQSEGRDEIMTDIESRIAEMLQEKMHGGKEVINSVDINAIIAIMGQPEDYITDDLDDEPQTKSSSNHQQNTYNYSSSKRRLFRDTDSNMVGGVCSGVGYYFGIDPIWIRLGFVLSVLFAGTGFLFYLILWIIMPEAHTPSEKLAMKGEPVTFENIGKTVEEEIENVKKKLNNLDGNNVRQHADNFQSGAKRVGDFALSILKFAFKAIGKILGVIFIVGGILLILGLFFGAYIPFNVLFVNTLDFTNLIFASGSDFWLSIVGGAIIIGIPLLALVLAGFILLFNIKMPKYTGLVLAVVWVIGLIFSTIGGISTGLDFSKESTISEMSTLPIESDTLYFDVLDTKKLISRSHKSHPDNDFFEPKNGNLTTNGVGVDVLMSKTTYPEIEIIKSARGRSHDLAEVRASTFEFNWKLDSNVIKLDPYINVNKGDKWRNQEAKLILYLPIGKTIFIPKSFKYLLDDVKNYTNTYDQNMVEMYWTMTDSGLVSNQIMSRNGMEQYINTIEVENNPVKLTVTTGDEEHSITIK
tara:strand:- start:49004 stop:50686 length:1683 start_codon:yes stop_codon:yes gene_type:complete